jgi:hypothetical protein
MDVLTEIGWPDGSQRRRLFAHATDAFGWETAA